MKDTANSLGLHDTLQYGPRSIAAEIKTESGLRERLENVRSIVSVHLARGLISHLVGGDARQPQTDSPAQPPWHARSDAPPHGAQDSSCCEILF